MSQQNQGQNQNPSGKSRSRNQRRRRGGANKAKRPGDLWRPVPQLADPQPIVPAPDPTALLRSLGDPPLQGQGAVAEHYLAAVVERAAGLATALAVAAGLLADADADADADEDAGTLGTGG